ncbi:hypothetical protein EAO70_03540 [Streptomyces sp. adm13(2018)]|nr:hypothetical protein EAO70_03540 [Streptomyces sp. adm13(2018)]
MPFYWIGSVARLHSEVTHLLQGCAAPMVGIVPTQRLRRSNGIRRRSAGPWRAFACAGRLHPGSRRDAPAADPLLTFGDCTD